MGGRLSAWSGATDGYDADLDVLAYIGDGPGFAGVYHVNDVAGWTGPTGFYYNDYRAPLAPDESKTWAPIYVWASESYTDPLMYFSLEADGPPFPPRERKYSLQLTAVPEGLGGAPPVGTSWALLAEGSLFTLELPTWATSDGLTGYQFSFTMTAVLPEPATALTCAAALLLRRRR